MNEPLPRRRPPWIWARLVAEVGLCRLCSRSKWASPGAWEVCRYCDMDPAHPPSTVVL